MKTDFVKKSLVVGTIFLFIGVGVYPAIAVKLNTSINTVQDEKSNVDSKKIEQLPDLPCNCKKDNKTDWPPAELCEYLSWLWYILMLNGLYHIANLILRIIELLNCPHH